MPSQWSIVDNNFPQYDRTTRMSEFVPKLMNYMSLLVENMKYLFENLGADNFNETALDSLKKDTTQKVEEEVTNMGGTLDETNQTVLQMAQRIGELEQENQQLQQTIEQLSIEIGQANADLNTLFTLIQANGDGSFTIGTEGTALALVGSVTINGREV